MRRDFTYTHTHKQTKTQLKGYSRCNGLSRFQMNIKNVCLLDTKPSYGNKNAYPEFSEEAKCVWKCYRQNK